VSGDDFVTTRRLLLVDDEEGLRLTLAANLELEGFEVVEAEDADAALEQLAERSFDLVLSDVQMPGRSGVELLREIKRRAPGTPVVLMTAFTEESAVDEAIYAGVFAVLAKPFDVDGVVGTLTRALRASAVLVVDDDAADAASIVGGLRAAGLRALAATGGEPALRAVAEEAIDVCVTDLMMPGMSGVETLLAMRKLAPDVTVIVFSGQEVPDLMRRAAAAGAFHCLRKPVDVEHLLRTIARARARGAG
jgi:DNA-binding NtrC family response regulator